MTRLTLFIKDASLRRYAIRRAFARLQFDLEAFRRWTRNMGLHPPTTRSEVNDSVTEVLLQRQRERAALPVPSAAGWSPYAAAQFLVEHGLATDDYHRLDGDQWVASSRMIELDKDALLSDNIAYYIDGSELAARQLMVELNVNGRGDTAASEKVFVSAAEALLQSALGQVPPTLLEDIQRGASVEAALQERRVKTEKKRFKGHAFNGYSRTLTITQNHPR